MWRRTSGRGWLSRASSHVLSDAVYGCPAPTAGAGEMCCGALIAARSEMAPMSGPPRAGELGTRPSVGSGSIHATQPLVDLRRIELPLTQTQLVSAVADRAELS